MEHIVNVKGVLRAEVSGEYIQLGQEDCAEAGNQLAQSYQSALPFPHAVIENFLAPDILARVQKEFPAAEAGRFSNQQSRLKTGYQLEKITSPFINSLINALNSAAFLVFLQKMSGIEGLIPDPYQIGGGLHETRRGGHLSIHADFNFHPKMKLQRRLNLILFLNDNWEEDFGGHLELWSKDMARCEKKVSPKLGTAVIFNTDADSFHGHPDPLTCPEDRTRRSIALYYYTAGNVLTSDQHSRSTDFRVRPGSSDRIDTSTSMRHLFRDICPPLLYRALNRD